MSGLSLRLYPGTIAVCKLPRGACLPEWATTGPLSAVTWTDAETSIVCAESQVPEGVLAETGWRAIGVEGPLDFGLTGVLASIAHPLADVGVSIFAISTYDTDYLLVKDASLPVALDALSAAGHTVRETF